MTAAEHLSPAQFGFTVIPGEQHFDAMDAAYTSSPTPGRINPQSEIHTGQPHMWQAGVDKYLDNPSLRAESPVEIYHHDGKMYAGEGHHRLAAARLRGAKSTRVMHYGK